MDYSKLSDAEINYKVAIKIGINASLILSMSGYSIGGSASKWVRDNTKDASFDPCNNAADAWPIITKSLIELVPNKSGEWRANSVCGEFRQPYQANPLRAAMIVFLMMQGDDQ